MSNSNPPERFEFRADLNPKFCSRCLTRFTEEPGQCICPSCGDPLIDQGYCPVCEAYWAQAVGTSCPKHDLPLERGRPPSLPLKGSDEPLQWVTVRHFADAMAAQAPRIRLEAEGIPTVVDNERMGSRSMYAVATGGVKLRVPDYLASDARVILSQTWSKLATELDIDPHEDEDDDWEQHEPERENVPLVRLISPLQIGLFLVALGLPALFLAYLLLQYWSEN